jgi:hypothetical protein
MKGTVQPFRDDRVPFGSISSTAGGGRPLLFLHYTRVYFLKFLSDPLFFLTLDTT